MTACLKPSRSGVDLYNGLLNKQSGVKQKGRKKEDEDMGKWKKIKGASNELGHSGL